MRRAAPGGREDAMNDDFDPNAAPGPDAGIFGLPFPRERCRLVLVPVPWDLTTSYRAGTAHGPGLVLQASSQLDLFDLELGKAYAQGYFLDPIPAELLARNEALRPAADRLRALDHGDPAAAEIVAEINAACEQMNAWVYAQARAVLAEGKLLGLLGGDHSVPYSAIRAVSERHGGDFGVLHVDAHADLRVAYEGFVHSHASIMHNVMSAPWRPRRLVQVGIRDFCEQEYELIRGRPGEITTFFDRPLKSRMLRGEPFAAIADEIVAALPTKVYVSFDIDGLDPTLCPGTGTPVPGGLRFDEALELLAALHRGGKTIVGFDLNEVSGGGPPASWTSEWDGNVGARLLYKLCGWSMITNGLSPAP
jgi:agmatinase